jgi:hypothetical protein
MIVLDTALKEKLLAAGGSADLYDESGQFLGRFVIRDDPSLYERPELDISEEELKRLLSPDAKTYTTAEVLAYLRSLK